MSESRGIPQFANAPPPKRQRCPEWREILFVKKAAILSENNDER